MKKIKDKNIEKLNKILEEYEKSGLKVSEFMRRHMFEEYINNGDKKIEDIAKEYFIEHLE